MSPPTTLFFSLKLKRLQNMIQLETFAMTGYKFFHLSRPMILSVSTTGKSHFFSHLELNRIRLTLFLFLFSPTFFFTLIKHSCQVLL